MARRAKALLGLAAALTGVSLLWLTGAGTAASEAAPTNTTEPRIMGDPKVGSTLTATRGAGAIVSYILTYNRVTQDLADLLSQAQVSPSGDRVVLRLSLTDDQMTSLIKKNTFALKM